MKTAHDNERELNLEKKRTLFTGPTSHMEYKSMNTVRYCHNPHRLQRVIVVVRAMYNSLKYKTTSNFLPTQSVTREERKRPHVGIISLREVDTGVRSHSHMYNQVVEIKFISKSKIRTSWLHDCSTVTNNIWADSLQFFESFHGDNTVLRARFLAVFLHHRFDDLQMSWNG